MFLNARHIGTSVDWLTHRASPPVRYLTHKYILDDDPESPELTALYNDVVTSPEAEEIFGKQDIDGSWCAGGGWAAKPSYKSQEGYEPTTPKYVTTAWILPLLGEMGIDRRDARVRRAANYLLTYQWPNGFFASHHGSLARHFAETGVLAAMPCHFAVYLWAFASAGMAADPQLKKSFDLLVSWQLDDGGWLDARHEDGTVAPYKKWDRSCPWSTYHAALALYHANIPDYREIRPGHGPFTTNSYETSMRSIPGRMCVWRRGGRYWGSWSEPRTILVPCRYLCEQTSLNRLTASRGSGRLSHRLIE